MTKSIERLGFMRVGYSGFYLHRGTERDYMPNGDYYYSNALVLGWWAYMWREWHIKGAK